MKCCGWNRRGHALALIAGASLAAGLTAGLTMHRVAQPMNMKHEKPSPEMMKKVKMLQDSAPALGYIKAHKDLRNPFGLLGGPISINVSQNEGGVFVALPDQRVLDPYVFGTPMMPRSFAGTPGISGVPPMPGFRGSEGGHYTRLQKMTPFGDKFIAMGGAKMSLRAIDATATDAASSEDSVRFEASWKDKAGHTYGVTCNKVIPHGMEFPTFGGVMTNHLLHGFTRLGTPLMPTEFTYVAFWGMGNVTKDGQDLGMRMVHGMLTEYVRKEGYKLAMDDEVTPARRQFHLMVAPFMPDMDNKGHFKHVPVHTGFKLPNGMELPFWHVMFENLKIDAHRV